jgi:hypothetical protein
LVKLCIVRSLPHVNLCIPTYSLRDPLSEHLQERSHYANRRRGSRPFEDSAQTRLQICVSEGPPYGDAATENASPKVWSPLWRRGYRKRVSKGAPLETLLQNPCLQRCSFGEAFLEQVSPKVHLWRRGFYRSVSKGELKKQKNHEMKYILCTSQIYTYMVDPSTVYLHPRAHLHTNIQLHP